MIERIVATFLAPVLIGQKGLSAEDLDGPVEDGASLAGTVGVIQIDGRLGGRSLGPGERGQQQDGENTVHSTLHD